MPEIFTLSEVIALGEKESIPKTFESSKGTSLPPKVKSPTVEYHLMFPENTVNRLHEGIFIVMVGEIRHQIPIISGKVVVTDPLVKQALIDKGFIFMYHFEVINE